MKFLFLVITELIFCSSVFADECAIAHSAIEKASEVRGLKVLHQVPCRLSTKEDVEKYLKATIEKKVSREKMKYEERVFKALGIIPQNYDYLNGVIKLYRDQLGGYYDPDKKYYVMAKWLPEVMQLPIAIHELTHALQDQHFNLKMISEYETEPSDSLMARSALIEGDASAVMTDYTRKFGGRPALRDDPDIESVMLENISGAMLSSSLSETPPALQALLVFPYVSGLRFVHSLLRSGGYADVDKAFKKLPESCEEILHPEKYQIRRRDFKELDPYFPESVANGKKHKVLYKDRLGEFLISSLLGTFVSPVTASSAAMGWGGDKVAVLEGDNGKQIITWNTAWDSEKDAQEFYETLIAAYNKRFGNTEESAESKKFSDTASWDSKEQKTSLHYTGKSVTVVVD